MFTSAPNVLASVYSVCMSLIKVVEYPLETVQGPRRGHAGHADSTELNLRHIEGDGGRLQASLHYFQWTSQYGSYGAPTSGKKAETEKKMWR